MAIINVTDDSFYGASRNYSCEDIEERVQRAVEDGVSATQVREFIMTDDDRLKQVVPTSVYENKESIKQLITLSKLKQ